jgi:hypothetical protein
MPNMVDDMYSPDVLQNKKQAHKLASPRSNSPLVNDKDPNRNPNNVPFKLNLIDLPLKEDT